jgi:hypothetical protein
LYFTIWLVSGSSVGGICSLIICSYWRKEYCKGAEFGTSQYGQGLPHIIYHTEDITKDQSKRNR